MMGRESTAAAKPMRRLPGETRKKGLGKKEKKKTETISNYEYRASKVTDVGTRKKINQDAVCIKAASFNGEPCIFALVADGMGGIDSGEMASGLTKSCLETWFCERLPNILEENKEDELGEAIIEEWQDAIEMVNRKLNDDMTANCGTTLTMAFLYNGRYYAANIGDSRLYKYEKTGDLNQITVDHSWVQSALEEGMTAEEIEKHPNKHKLLRCIGAHQTKYPQVDYYTGVYEEGVAFLLCSDGLRHTIKVSEFEETLQDIQLDTMAAAEHFVNLAKKRGEEDNITAALVRITKGDAPKDDDSKTEILEKK